MPGKQSIEQQLEDAKTLAAERCITAGGNPHAIEIVEIDLVPISYVTNGATRVMVRVVSDLVDSQDAITVEEENLQPEPHIDIRAMETADKALHYEVVSAIDIESYRPRIQGVLWYVSQTDLDFLQDGTGVLAVGSCGEPYPTYLACMELLKGGIPITIRQHESIKDSEVVLTAGFMVSLSFAVPRCLYMIHNINDGIKGSPSVYEERVPGLNE